MYMRGFILPYELDNTVKMASAMRFLSEIHGAHNLVELNLFQTIANAAFLEIKYENALFFSEPGIRYSFPADDNLYCSWGAFPEDGGNLVNLREPRQY